MCDRSYSPEEIPCFDVNAGGPIGTNTVGTGSALEPANASSAGSTKIIRDAVKVRQVDDFDRRVSATGRCIRSFGGNLSKLHEVMKTDSIRDRAYASNSEMGLAYVRTLLDGGYSNEAIAGDVLDPSNPAGIHFRGQKDNFRAIERAIGKALLTRDVTAQESKTGVHFPDGWSKDLRPLEMYGNVRAAIDALGVNCRYDLFREATFIESHNLEELTGDFADHTVTVIQNIIYDKFEFYPSAEHVRNSIIARARENSFNPVRDAIDSLVWDGTLRLDTWLPTYMGAAHSSFVHAVGRKTLIGLVRRVRKPGCKNDSVLILEGAQGVGKSLMCRDLAGSEDLFSDAEFLALDGKAQQELLQGKLICELPELAGLRRAEVEKTKALVTRTHDLARPAYGRLTVNRARRCIFIGTTNEENYLRDHSGNRRFWPVRVSLYDREAFCRDRDQLLAEAGHYEAMGESLYLTPEVCAEAVSEQKARMVQDGWVDSLVDVSGEIHADEERVASKWLLEHRLQISPEKHNDAMLKRLSQSMHDLGWQGPKKQRVAGQVVWGYYRACKSVVNKVPF